jgi:hypothetical protein
MRPKAQIHLSMIRINIYNYNTFQGQFGTILLHNLAKLGGKVVTKFR